MTPDDGREAVMAVMEAAIAAAQAGALTWTQVAAACDAIDPPASTAAVQSGADDDALRQREALPPLPTGSWWPSAPHRTEDPAPGLDPLELPAALRCRLAHIPVRSERWHYKIFAFVLVALIDDIPSQLVSQPARDSSPAGWWGGASPDEILAFDLYPYETDPEGSAMHLLDPPTLRQHLESCRLRLQSLPTPWLHRYGRALIAERQRRGGLAG